MHVKKVERILKKKDHLHFRNIDCIFASNVDLCLMLSDNRNVPRNKKGLSVCLNSVCLGRTGINLRQASPLWAVLEGLRQYPGPFF